MIAAAFSQQTVFPRPFVYFVILICFSPFILNMSGVDFTSFSIELTAERVAEKGIILDDLFYALAGGLQHALLEWSSVIIAMLTALLAFAHYRTKNDITVPIIGVALLASGFIDAFHTLAATRLIDAVATIQN